MSTATLHDFATEALDDLKSELSDPPQPLNLTVLLAWIIQLFNLVHYALDVIFQRIDRDIAEVAANIAAPKTTFAATVVSPLTASTNPPTVGSSTARAPSTTLRLRARCINCHARGHVASDCRTTNPSAMRKRVARNTRLAREARAHVAVAALPVAPPSPNAFGTYFPQLVPPTHMVYSALVADSTELRRRAAQSARDKRRRQRPALP